MLDGQTDDRHPLITKAELHHGIGIFHIQTKKRRHLSYTNLVFCDGEFILNSNQLIMISEIKKTYQLFL